MTTHFIQDDITTSLGSISGKEDLVPRPGFNLNSPPSDGRCECCGKSFEELKAFDWQGHIFDGALLAKNFRPMGLLTEDEIIIKERFFGSCQTEDDQMKARELLTNEYGAEGAKDLEIIFILATTIQSSWECVDCFVLDDLGYQEKINELYAKKRPLVAIRALVDDSYFRVFPKKGFREVLSNYEEGSGYRKEPMVLQTTKSLISVVRHPLGEGLDGMFFFLGLLIEESEAGIIPLASVWGG